MNIVLAPGVLGFKRLAGLEYFRGVAGRLRASGAHVLPATTDPLGTIEDRAQRLARQIQNALSPAAAPGERLDLSQPIHILAHSMGGLDARLLIAKNLRDLSSRIATLTTIGTPHFGSPVATLLDKGNVLEILSPLLALDGELVGELRALRDRTNAVHDLSEAAARQFNDDCPDDPRVKYFEVVGAGREGRFHTAAFYALTFLFVNAKAGKNDGVVSLKSATRNFTRQPIAAWPGDHADLLGHDMNDLSGPPVFPHLERYEELVRKISST
jgi:triacylglycerol lipase